jgi:hypothetical protein
VRFAFSIEVEGQSPVIIVCAYWVLRRRYVSS